MSVKLYGRATSYNVQKVLWFLDELNLHFEHIEYGGRFKGLESDEFFKLNPFRKIPVIVDNEKCIRESNTILRYLAASFANEIWSHTDPYCRSRYESWMDWSIDVFEKAFVGVFWGFYRTPETRRDWPMISLNKNKCNDCLGMIENQLTQQPYLAGNRISLADISVGVFMYRLCEIDLDFEFAPATLSWYEKLSLRPAYQKWVMSDFSELKGREDY